MLRLLRRAALVFAALCGSLAATPAIALLVRPVVIDLTSSGSGASASLEVVNDRNKPMAVEVKVQKLVLAERGEPSIQPDSGDDFLIFPTVANIGPGERQVFRIRYIGDPAIAQSKLYMFSTSELPVALNPAEKGAQLQVLYSINSVVAVKPLKGQSNIRIAAVQQTTSAKGVPGIEVTFENAGSAHGYVGKDTIELTSGSWHKTLDPPQVSKALGLGLVPPNAKREMFIALPDAPASGPISGELKPAS